MSEMSVKTLSTINKIKNLLPELDYTAIQLVRTLVERRYHEASAEKESE